MGNMLYMHTINLYYITYKYTNTYNTSYMYIVYSTQSMKMILKYDRMKHMWCVYVLAYSTPYNTRPDPYIGVYIIYKFVCYLHSSEHV